MIFAFKQLAFAAFLFRLLDLAQVHVDQVSNIVAIQSVAVVVDHLPVKVEHLLAVALDLVFGINHTGQVLRGGQILDHQHLAEQTHALLDEEREPLEERVIFGEAHRHQHITDHVGGGHRECGCDIDGLALGLFHSVQETLDFGLRGTKERRGRGG